MIDCKTRSILNFMIILYRRFCFGAPAFLGCACLVVLSPVSKGQGTIPVGFETVTVHANTYSLLAPVVHPNILKFGTFDNVTATQVTDTAANFEELDRGVVYVVEQNGPLGHRVVEVVSFSGSTLTLAEPGLMTTSESYALRPLWRLSELLSPVLVPEFNTVEDFNPDSGDLILIPDGTGGFRQYYYSSFPGYGGYFNAGTGAAEDPFIRYTDAIVVLRQGPSFDTVFSGELKVSDTGIPLAHRFSPIGSILPIGSLESSELAASVNPGAELTADHIWLQNVVTGDLQQYYYSDGSGPGLTPGWRRVGAALATRNLDQGAIQLSPGMVIRRRGPLPHEVVIKGIEGYWNP